MTILHKAAMLPLDSIVSTELLLRIAEEGHSRLPIYNTARENIVGVLLTKVPLFPSPACLSQLPANPHIRCSISSACCHLASRWSTPCS